MYYRCNIFFRLDFHLRLITEATVWKVDLQEARLKPITEIEVGRED